MDNRTSQEKQLNVLDLLKQQVQELRSKTFPDTASRMAYEIVLQLIERIKHEQV